MYSKLRKMNKCKVSFLKATYTYKIAKIFNAEAWQILLKEKDLLESTLQKRTGNYHADCYFYIRKSEEILSLKEQLWNVKMKPSNGKGSSK